MSSCHVRPPGFRGIFRDDPAALAVYSEAAGIGRIVPSAIVVPVDADDVVTIVKWASASSIPLIPRGSGTSMAGGAIGSGVIVDMSQLNHIGDIDPLNHSVWVGPGALRGAVNRRANESGCRFPVDPSSGEFCTIGGMVSTNAAGAHTLRFGATRDWVISLDCIFDDGSRAIVSRLRPLPDGVSALERFSATVGPAIRNLDGDSSITHEGVAKDSSGYGIAAYAHSGKLVDLLVGSEGTLVLIVGIELGLAPTARSTSGILGAFSNLDDAVMAAGKARSAGAVACELLDRTFLDVASSGGTSPVAALSSIPAGTEAVLLAEVEGANDHEVETAAGGLEQSFREAGATITKVAVGASEQHEIWELRHAASPILSKLDPALKSMQFIEDSAVPPENLAEYVKGVRAAFDRNGVRGVIFGHAGDAHMHVNPLIDTGKPDWRRKVESLLDDVVALTARLGGTLSGEHGDGRLRTPLLDKIWSAEARELFAKVKSAFDPKGILNPGVKVPLENQHALGDIKYDPSLPPLPPDARSALDMVSAERAYSTLRLSLIPESR